MTGFYFVPSAYRMIIQIFLALGMACETAILVLTLFKRSRREFGFSLMFELGILYHYLILNLSLGLIQLTAPNNLFLNPYITARNLSIVVPILGMPLLLREKREVDLLAMIALIFSMPVTEEILGSQLFYGQTIFLLLLLLRSFLVFFEIIRTGGNGLSRFSIKEAFDRFPSGLALGRHHGGLLILNDKMRSIMKEKGLVPNRRSSGVRISFRRMIKREAFTVEEGVLNPSALAKLATTTEKNGLPEILSFTSQGTTYHYSDNPFKIGSKTYRQILVTDITPEADLLRQIQDKNRELRESNEQLETLLIHMEEIEQEKESSRMRNRIHDVMGQRLSILHSTLQQMENEKEPPIEELISLLEDMLVDLKDPETIEPEDRFRYIQNSAQIVGTEVIKEGELPREDKIAVPVLQVVREAVTNAIRHGHASEVQCIFTQNEENYEIRISNNGSIPNQQVHEGEGIQGMRKKLQDIRGQLIIETQGQFEMRITIPKGEPPTRGEKSTEAN